MKKNYSIWILTGIVVIAALCILLFKSTEVKTLKLNEIADFIAVFVSALAFIWLIYGYQLQAIELRLQREELKNQVENSRKLVEQAVLQTSADMDMISIEQNRIKEEFTHSIRPILVFYNTGKDDSGTNRWGIKNVGNSPAINVLITCGSKELEWVASDAVLFPAIAQNETKLLNWITRHGALVSICSDIENNNYTTVCTGNKNKISKGNVYPNLIPNRFEYQLDQDQMN
jgi:hypothetical protein